MLLVLILFFIFILFIITIEPEEFVTMKKEGDYLLKECGFNNKFTLNLSKKLSYTSNKKDIYLVIGNKDKKFDYNTIYHVFIHELAHVVQSGDGHDDNFYQIEKLLQEKAKELNYYKDTIIDPNYPCHL